MKFSAVLALGLAAFALAKPIPDAEAEASDVSDKRDLQSNVKAALPHPIQASDIMVSDEEPADLVTRANANATATNAKKGKGKGKGNGNAKGKGKGNGNAKGKGSGKGKNAGKVWKCG